MERSKEGMKGRVEMGRGKEEKEREKNEGAGKGRVKQTGRR